MSEAFETEAFQEIKRRCEGAGLDYEEILPEEAAYVYYPVGRGIGRIGIHDDDRSARMLLSQPFEAYKGIEGFAAIWSPEQRVIECSVFQPNPRLAAWADWLLLNSLGVDVELDIHIGQQRFTPDQRAEFSSSTGLAVSIGPCSDIHGIFVNSDDFLDADVDQDEMRHLTLRIEGADVERHDDALELLRRVADATFFQMDISRGHFLTLERTNHKSRTNSPLPNISMEAGSIGDIRFEYDHGPMSLYWHGKMAYDMPLLQFLAYYQVLEFYFPYYSETAAAEALQNVLKEPTFDPLRGADIARLLRAIKVNSKGRTFGNDAEQLEATVRHCVSADDLEGFLMSDNEGRYEFYTSNKAKRIVKEPIPLREKSGDILGATAKRIYAIRNRIVHTKGGFSDQEPLFPFDPEVKYLSHDIDLVEFLARKVLIASSRPLEI